MKGLLKVTIVAALAGALASVALSEEGKAKAAAKPAAKKAAKKAVSMPVEELKWMPSPGNADVKMAVAWGDPDKGPHGAFHKFPAGFVAPLHTHSADLKIAVISGTFVTTGEGETEKKCGPGSYLFDPAGWKHVTKCEAGADCVAFVVASGKFDIKMVEDKKAEGGQAKK